MLSQVTKLLALVSAPPLEATTVGHVEVLLLQPSIVMVVVITSTGGVTKRGLHVRAAVDPGLAKWAGEYLNERVAGLQLGTTRLRRALRRPEPLAARARIPRALAAGVHGSAPAEQRLYVGGAAGLLDEVRDDELGTYRHLFVTLEKRAALLEVLGAGARPAADIRPRRATSSSTRASRSWRSSARATGS